MNTSHTVSKSAGRIVTNDESVLARYKLNDIFCGLWLSHTVAALAWHKVPESIGADALSVDEIADKCGLHAPSLLRALSAAAANGIFAEVRPGFFANNPVSHLLRADNPYSWSGMARMWTHPSAVQAWQHFPDVLVDGRSGIEHAFGKTLYEHLAEVPGATMAFSDAMVSNSAHVSQSIAREFAFEKYERVMDLGGGVGTLLCTILQAHQHLSGAIFEIAELVEPATAALRQAGLASRAAVTAGNFVESIPPDFDLYLIKNSLWNWDDDNSAAIIQNVRTAIGSNRKAGFVIIEYIIDDENAPWTRLYDLQILNLPGGRARTVGEYTKLLANQGFAVERIQYVEDQTLLIAKPM